MEDELRVISEASLRRLPRYLHFLKQLAGQGQTAVSCPQIAREFKLAPTQIRKDLAATGIAGRAKVGYDTAELIDAVEEFLGWKNVNDAFLAGAGSLGSALLGYAHFQDQGLNIVAVFDNDPDKIGREIHGREILPLEKLPELAQRMNVHIGVIAVPASAAQDVATLMVLGGVVAVWNFAPAPLDVPENVIVENAQLSTSLGVLTSKLKRAFQWSRRLGTSSHAHSDGPQI